MDSGSVYERASVAAKTRHFEELFAIWGFALWTHNCTVKVRSLVDCGGNTVKTCSQVPDKRTLDYRTTPISEGVIARRHVWVQENFDKRAKKKTQFIFPLVQIFPLKVGQ
jgi:hypothetical protein